MLKIDRKTKHLTGKELYLMLHSLGAASHLYRQRRKSSLWETKYNKGAAQTQMCECRLPTLGSAPLEPSHSHSKSKSVALYSVILLLGIATSSSTTNKRNHWKSFWIINRPVCLPGCLFVEANEPFCLPSFLKLPQIITKIWVRSEIL